MSLDLKLLRGYLFALIFLFELHYVSSQDCSFAQHDTLRASSVSQYGITFFFDKEYTVGQFANGDYWVLGPLTIIRITPEWDGQINGYENNCGSSIHNGFDYRINGFDSSLVKPLPLTINPISVMIKVMSVPKSAPDEGPNTPWLQTAVALTIVAVIPENNGSTVFRPPYFGPVKPLFSTKAIRWDKHPNVKPPAGVKNVPQLSWIVKRFQRVQLDHKNTWQSINMHPIDNMPNYGSDIARDTGDACLRLLLDDVSTRVTNNNGTCAMVQYLQFGIDLYGMVKGGMEWPANGGHANGRKLPVLFAGYLLNSTDILQAVAARLSTPTTFSEDSELFVGKAGVVMFGVGTSECAQDKIYWDAVNSPEGGGYGKYCRDPYGFIDGCARPGTSYQWCCTSMNWKVAAIPLVIIPELQQHWGNDMMLTYIKRWVYFGAWALPDPCAGTDNVTADYRVKYGPDSQGSCIAGKGRFPTLHGTNADTGGYRSAFGDSMWPHFFNKTEVLLDIDQKTKLFMM